MDLRVNQEAERSQLIKTVVIDDELSKEEEVDILLVSEAERTEGIMDFLHLECNPTINFRRGSWDVDVHSDSQMVDGINVDAG